MKKIKLTKNKFALVDDEDFEYLDRWKWRFTSKGYAARSQRIGPRVEGKQKTIYMHRIVNQTPIGHETDHHNGNRLDNQKSNLRPCTRSQNRMNSDKRASCTSKYKGVSWKKQDSIWVAQVKVNGLRKHIGYFCSERLAAQAYDSAAIKYYGEFARLNFKYEAVVGK